MQRITDPNGKLIENDFRMIRDNSEPIGELHAGTGEYRKQYNGTYYFSANGTAYVPLTLQQARARGLHTFE